MYSVRYVALDFMLTWVFNTTKVIDLVCNENALIQQ